MSQVTAADVLARVGSETELLFCASQIDRRLVLAPGLPPLGDGAEVVVRLLVRLVASAVRFSDQGRVVLGVDRFGDRLEFWVSDEGVWVSAAEKERSLNSDTGDGQRFRQWRDELAEIGGEMWIEQGTAGGTDSGSTARISVPIANNSEVVSYG